MNILKAEGSDSAWPAGFSLVCLTRCRRLVSACHGATISVAVLLPFHICVSPFPTKTTSELAPYMLQMANHIVDIRLLLLCGVFYCRDLAISMPGAASPRANVRQNKFPSDAILHRCILGLVPPKIMWLAAEIQTKQSVFYPPLYQNDSEFSQTFLQRWHGWLGRDMHNIYILCK